MLKENISKEAPRLTKNSHRLPNINRRILHSKWGILQSLMPNEHPGLFVAVHRCEALSS